MKKEQFYPLGIFLAAMVGALSAISFPLGYQPVQIFLGEPFSSTIWEYSAWSIW
ncbi:CrcB protein [Streptococcus oralis]|uniref:CrcB protein n=1 Tax=Streptococcus oralis TaxID=1303 RepID=A0A139PZL2_STROR|nr:CrcB protein [Streptococcus oralis]